MAETRGNWIANNIRLLRAIPVPTGLLWFSERSPDCQEQYKTPFTFFGGFPQLVNRAMIDALRPHCDHYRECVTRRGMPQPLISRFSDKPTTIDSGTTRKELSTGKCETHNTYYPSPQMQQDAAAALLETCRRLL